MADIYDLICSRRSIRKFLQKPIPYDVLERCVNAARLAPSAANLQPLEFIIIDDAEIRKLVFTTLRWAGYIKPHGNPKPNEEPTAYIVVLSNKKHASEWTKYDVGLATENIIIAALAQGVASCIIGSIEKERLHEILKIPLTHDIELVVALGYPAHKSTTVMMSGDGNVRYWKDDTDTFYVPKRDLRSVLHRNSYGR
ncbi:MAG: nitroreductase family protein [Candidatus Micrarchaeia archaeon]